MAVEALEARTQIYDGRGPRRKEIIQQEQEYEWWYKPHPIVFGNEAFAVPGLRKNEIDGLRGLTNSIYRSLADSYGARNNPVVLMDNGSTKNFWNKPDTYTPPQYQAGEKKPPYLVAINPVFLGKIPPEVKQAMKKVGSGEIDPKKDDNLKNLVRVLKNGNLPEQYPPFMEKVGKQICKKMNIGKEVHSNFMNMVFIDDTDGTYRKASYKAKQLFNWALMGKLGSFKNIVVPYYRNDTGKLIFNKVFLSSLEGGHPALNLRELSKRIMVFGSLQDAGSWKEYPYTEVDRDIFAKSDGVNGIRKLGRFMGRNRLLSPPIAIHDLVRHKKLTRMLEFLASFASQAEGAFMAFDPEYDLHIPGVEWNGSAFVTISGKFGALKTHLYPEDIDIGFPWHRAEGSTVGVVPIVKMRRDIRINDKTGRRDLFINKVKTRGPSVEASEFLLPLEGLFNDYKNSPILLRKVEGGYIYDEVSGDKKVPPIRGVIHMHRDFDVQDQSGEVIVVPTNITKYPAVGCGVDAMEEMSKYAMKEAVRLWEAGDRKAKYAVFSVPNHGTNVFVFWHGDIDTGIIPADPFVQFRQSVENGEIIFKPEVPQV